MEKPMIADTSGLPFMDLRDEGMCYVDKSMLIADILGTDPNGVFLYTRPRRFGKSTNVSMLDAFLNIDYEGNGWFDGLAISEHHELDAYKNNFPVVYMDLKDLAPVGGNAGYALFLDNFRETVRETYMRYGLREWDDLDPGMKDDAMAILDQSADTDLLKLSARRLCEILGSHHDRKAVVLIDEYDRAVTDTFGEEYHQSIVDFLTGFMSATLVGNECLQLAYITGVMQVTGSGLFSEVGNLRMNDLFSKGTREPFGFTDEEVADILRRYGRGDRSDEVRGWYGGYRFGDAEVCNPFGIMSYVSSGFKPRGYWSESGSDRPMRWLVAEADTQTMDAVSKLVSGQLAATEIRLGTAYGNSRPVGPEGLFSLLVEAGYLRASPRGDGRCDVSIPNRDVMGMVENIMDDFISMDRRMFGEFRTAVAEADAVGMESALRSLFGTARHLDLGSAEIAMMFIMRDMLEDYDIRTDRGDGTAYIVMDPKRDGSAPTIIGIEVDGTGTAEDIVSMCNRRQPTSEKAVAIGIAFRGTVPEVGCRIVDRCGVLNPAHQTSAVQLHPHLPDVICRIGHRVHSVHGGTGHPEGPIDVETDGFRTETERSPSMNLPRGGPEDAGSTSDLWEFSVFVEILYKIRRNL